MLSKDRIRVVGVYKAPGVSQADFEIKFKAMAAAFTASPISQNLIKYERLRPHLSGLNWRLWSAGPF
jgi:hypothetical protein